MTKRAKVYLFLTIACFIGLIAIFAIDGFFLSMRDVPQLAKIMVSILLGVALIFFSAYLQRRRQANKT